MPSDTTRHGSSQERRHQKVAGSIPPNTAEERSDARAEEPGAPARIRSGTVTGLFALALFYTFYFTKALLIPIALALLLNLLLAPIVRILRKYARIPTGVGAALLLLLVVTSVAVIFYGLSGPTARWMRDLPLAMAEIQFKLDTLSAPVEEVQEAAKQLEELADESAPGEQQPMEVAVEGPSLTQLLVSGTATFIAGLIVTIALLFFLLASGDTLLRRAVTIAPGLREKRRVVEIVRETEDDISYYLLTVSMINAGLGVAIGTSLYLLGMPNAALWGVMAAVFNFVPFLGAVAGIGIVTLVALLTFDQPLFILLPPLVYLFLTSLEAQFVTPALLARRLTLNPVAVFLALIVWTWMWGIAGALLAVPLLATFKICCDHVEPLMPIGTMLGR